MYKRILTDPRKHNPNDFTYIVHSIIDEQVSNEEMKGRVNRILDPTLLYRASLVGHMDSESAKRRCGWHGGEYHRMFTFGKYGLIVNPATDKNILITWYCNLGSPLEQDALREFVNQHRGKVCKPIEIFTRSLNIDDIFGDNELIIEGHPESRIQGVFYRDDALDNAKRLYDIVVEATQEDIALVELPKTRVKDLSEEAERVLPLLLNARAYEFFCRRPHNGSLKPTLKTSKHPNQNQTQFIQDNQRNNQKNHSQNIRRRYNSSNNH